MKLSKRIRKAGTNWAEHGEWNVPVVMVRFADEVAQMEAENEALRTGVQEIRDVSGTEWGRVEMDSPWGKTLFWIMGKCEALLAQQEQE
jgi:hypothetical protein